MGIHTSWVSFPFCCIVAVGLYFFYIHSINNKTKQLKNRHRVKVLKTLLFFQIGYICPNRMQYIVIIFFPFRGLHLFCYQRTIQHTKSWIIGGRESYTALSRMYFPSNSLQSDPMLSYIISSHIPRILTHSTSSLSNILSRSIPRSGLSHSAPLFLTPCFLRRYKMIYCLHRDAISEKTANRK